MASTPTKSKRSWSDKSLAAKAKTVLLVLFVLVVLITLKGLIFGNPNDTKTSQSSQTQTVDQNAPEDKQIEQIARNALDGLEVREVRATEQVGGGYGVFVKYFDKRAVNKSSVGEHMADVYQALYTSGKNINTASVVATMSLTDQYGNETEEAVYKTTLDKATADKVNFNADEADLQYKILPGVWTVNSTHPALQD